MHQNLALHNILLIQSYLLILKPIYSVYKTGRYIPDLPFSVLYSVSGQSPSDLANSYRSLQSSILQGQNLSRSLIKQLEDCLKRIPQLVEQGVYFDIVLPYDFIRRLNILMEKKDETLSLLSPRERLYSLLQSVAVDTVPRPYEPSVHPVDPQPLRYVFSNPDTDDYAVYDPQTDSSVFFNSRKIFLFPERRGYGGQLGNRLAGQQIPPIPSVEQLWTSPHLLVTSLSLLCGLFADVDVDSVLAMLNTLKTIVSTVDLEYLILKMIVMRKIKEILFSWVKAPINKIKTMLFSYMTRIKGILFSYIRKIRDWIGNN